MTEKDNILITQYLANELSKAEKEAMMLRIDDDSDFKAIFFKQYDVWVKTGIPTVATQSEKKQQLDQIWRKLRPIQPKKVYLTFMRYAVVILLSLLLGGATTYWIFQNHQPEHVEDSLYVYSSGSKSISDITLPDGSNVKLNANTKITYADGQTRKILIDGEATFEVVHDQLRPFIVDCGELQIVDIGTKFNVKHREGDPIVETMLINGVVDLQVDEQKQLRMLPGQKALFFKQDKSIDVMDFDDQEWISWSQDRFYFQDVSLEIVLNQLAEWYEVKVEWRNKSLKNKEIYYNASRRLDLRSSMDLLHLLVDIDYEIEEHDHVPVTIIIH
ncbi:MAG: FecR domain-containing protein [Carboxylicivirga sp.]|jgi:ferric-dicitrate binding protein FerR (iron transport regulator)|nr:FecR domain-containing protein [Carboxylicivirga sp.]